jgi:hypothetical protein
MSKVPRVLTRKRRRNALPIRLSLSDKTIEIWLLDSSQRAKTQRDVDAGARRIRFRFIVLYTVQVLIRWGQ